MIVVKHHYADGMRDDGEVPLEMELIIPPGGRIEAYASPEDPGCPNCGEHGGTPAIRHDGGCPECGGDDLSFTDYDFGIDMETGWRDAGTRFTCRACGESADISEAGKGERKCCSLCAEPAKAPAAPMEDLPCAF